MTTAEAQTAVVPKPAPATPAQVRRPCEPGAQAGQVVRRRLKTALTVGLVITSLGAWVVALVQPWAGRSGDRGVVTVPAADLKEDWIRSVSNEEQSIPEKRKPPVRSLARNPFFSEALAAEEARVREPSREGTASPPAPQAPGASSAKAAPNPGEILAAVKGLRLEVTLTMPDGECWAVINGQNYRVGDTVNGFRLAEVQEGKVKLERGGVVCMLQME